MRHSKSRCRSPDKSGLRNEHSDISELVESRSEDPDVSGDADESAPVRLESRYIGTPTSREQAGPHLPVPIDPRYIGTGGIEIEG